MDIAITNVHLDLGAGRRGTDMGPSAMHVAGLMPALKKLGHQIKDIQSIGSQSYEALHYGSSNARFLHDIESVCVRLKEHIRRQLSLGCIPLVLGGDHSQAIGTISGVAEHYQARNQEIGVIWFDAHTDMNTPDTSPSGNIHGMPLSTLMGYGHSNLVQLNPKSTYSVRPEHTVIIGARDIDISEVPLVKELGVRVITMTEIDKRGAVQCFEEAIDIATRNTAGIHLSFDLDGVDPAEAPGVGTPVPGGFSLRESHLLCEMICATRKMIGMEMVELNPTLDRANQTARLAVWLIQSVFGKLIM